MACTGGPYDPGVNIHPERGRASRVALAVLVVLAAGVAVAISQWHLHGFEPKPAPSAGAEVPVPADTGDDGIIDQALGQIPVDSTELKNRWLDEVPGIDVSGLPPAQRTLFVSVANSYRCTCGCGFTLATCRAYDLQCPVSGPRVHALRASVRAGLVRKTGWRPKPKPGDLAHAPS